MVMMFLHIDLFLDNGYYIYNDDVKMNYYCSMNRNHDS